MTTVRKKQISLEMEKSGAETDKAAAAEEVTTTSVPDSTSDIKQDKVGFHFHLEVRNVLGICLEVSARVKYAFISALYCIN